MEQTEGSNKKVEEFDMLRDDVAFNEVVHRPPQLTALPRRALAVPAETRRVRLLLPLRDTKYKMTNSLLTVFRTRPHYLSDNYCV